MQIDEDVSRFENDFRDNFLLNSENAKNNGNFMADFNIGTLYDGEEAVGFDVSNGGEWIYPTNYPVRKYQKNIVSNALFKNTLVCLPTGLGKTFIAAVVMYNYHRWYPKHIVVFMAHSKPLVAQQVNACCNIMGIPPSSIAELNGNMLHSKRKQQWESKKVFFLTPQVFNNDLARGNVKAESVRCVVIDEAHKALGNQAYCQVIRSLRPFNSNFRVLALSATPGDDMNMVKEVIQNLMISHLELHNEEDPDIRPYLHKKQIETVVIKLDDQILNIKEQFFGAVQKYVTPLVRSKILPQSFSSISPFSLILKQRQFMQNPNVPPETRGIMLSNFSVAISLFYALEELMIYGMRSFVTKLKCLQSGEGSTNKIHHRIGNDSDIKSLIEHVDKILGPDRNVNFDVNSSLTRIFDEIDSIDPSPNIVYSHPKFVALEKIIRDHFQLNEDVTKVIVFCKSRQCTGEICNFLAKFKPLVKPMIFIGQSQTSSGIVTKGFNQAAQLTVMKRFREGVYNTLVATCVAEEGLDIGEVDLIVNFDSGKNSNTQVQRSGRTGRKRDGRVVNLVTEGKEQQNYNISVSKGKKMNKQLVRDSTKLPLYADNPRLIPVGLDPVCQEMYLSVKNVVEEETKGRKRKGKAGKKSRDGSAEGGQLNKKMKGCSDDKESLSTAIGNKFDLHNKEQKGKGYNSVNTANCDDVIDDCGNSCRIEVIDLEECEKSTMLLYNDDVKENADEPWESLSDVSESNLIVQFLKSNNLASKPKNKFKEFLDLKKYKKYLKLRNKCEIDLTSKMNAVGKYELNQCDTETLQNEQLDNRTLAKFIIESRERIFANQNGNNLGKESEIQIVENDFTDDFLRPFESFLKPNVVSSTPVRKQEISKIVEQPAASESDFHNWNESHFFNLKDSSRPKVDVFDKSDSKDMSMISITQALDIVNQTASNNTSIQKTLESSSPILFLRQKTKSTQSKFVPTSPILTQKTGTKTSRKCLKFKEPDIAPSICQNSAVKKPKIDAFDSSDLFAETEVALQNHLQEIELILSSQKGNSDSSSETVDYDVREINFDPNNTPSSLLNLRDTSQDMKGIERHSNLESSFGGVLRVNDEPAINQPSAQKTGTKMAVVRPMGFENTPLLNKFVKNSECTNNAKSDELSYTCNFSLFADDDFDENCFVTNVRETKENNTVEKSEKHIPNSEFNKSCDVFPNNKSVCLFEKDLDLFTNGDLSDGAIKALKAVELYEKSESIGKNSTFPKSNKKKLEIDSDDSDDFFLPKKNGVNTSKIDKSKVKIKPRKQTNKDTVTEFIEAEAGISDHGDVSSDEENTSGLDDYDSSFVDERELLTQAQDVDMTAKYLQSTKVAPKGIFKIPKSVARNELNVFSQIGSEGESEYENDSFCVSEEEASEVNEISELELAEIVLQNKRKREKHVDKNKRKLKRILRIESDTSEDEREALNEKPAKNCDNTILDVELFNSPFQNEACTKTISVKPVIFVASRQIASAPEITTSLRAKWNANVQVRSAPEADYIVSWRMGINRIQLSDFASGSPTAKNQLKEIVAKLSGYFQQKVLIIEDDKNKGLPSTTGRNKFMWSKHSSRSLVKTIESGVRVIFSRNKDDTARILVLLCNEEGNKGYNVDIKTEINSEVERKMKFYNILPGVNVVNAFRMSSKFSSIASFAKCCNSVQIIMREMGLKKDDAVKVYQLMFVSPCT